jgi:hypothetical protein
MKTDSNGSLGRKLSDTYQKDDWATATCLETTEASPPTRPGTRTLSRTILQLARFVNRIHLDECSPRNAFARPQDCLDSASTSSRVAPA